MDAATGTGEIRPGVRKGEKMTLEEAHKMLDEEYKKNETVEIGFKKTGIPDSVRVAAALYTVAEKANKESTFFE